jgi:Mn2+/Fe2+ NRAMP family transporter
MFISMGVLLLAVILDPENICRKTPGYNWLFLIAPSIEILISVSMIFLVINKSNKSQKLENYLKVVIVLVITYMIVDAGISSYLRYSTKKVKSQNREKTELDAPYNQLAASLG